MRDSPKGALMKRWRWFGLAAAAVLLLAVSPLRALGEEEAGAVHAKGACNRGSTWELVMEPEVGVKFEATIETGVPGQEWDITLRYERHVLIHQVEETEEDGGFEVITVESNKEGEDHAFVTAKNLDTGEVCAGQLAATL
jgi:hypothetical protein